jgi:uncharacterized membrane protein
MKSKIAVYDSREEAIKALELLNDQGFPMKKVSLLGKADVVDDHIHVKSIDKIKNAPVLLGVGAGTTLGLLAGLGAFTIPGFGFLYGAGAIIGALAGFDLGLVSGGLVTLLTELGIHKDHVVKVNEHLDSGRFVVIVQGSEEDVKRAASILNKYNKHHELM